MAVKYTIKDDGAEETVLIISKPKVLAAKHKSSLPITKIKHNDLKKTLLHPCDFENFSCFAFPIIIHHYLKLMM